MPKSKVHYIPLTLPEALYRAWRKSRRRQMAATDLEAIRDIIKEDMAREAREAREESPEIEASKC